VYADNVALPAFARCRPVLLRRPAAAAIDRYLLHAGPAAVNPQHAAAAVDNWDRQTDTVPFHRPCSTYCVGNANKGITQLLVCFVL